MANNVMAQDHGKKRYVLARFNDARSTWNMGAMGFTLIELMIVIAMIGVIAAMALPNFRYARMAANETAAVATLRTIHSAQTLYREHDRDGNGTLDYADYLSVLGAASLVDQQLATSTKQGYHFRMIRRLASDGPESVFHDATFFTWNMLSWPEQLGASGTRYFHIDQTGVIRQTTSIGNPYLNDWDQWPPVGQ